MIDDCLQVIVDQSEQLTGLEHARQSHEMMMRSRLGLIKRDLIRARNEIDGFGGKHADDARIKISGQLARVTVLENALMAHVP